MNAAEYAAKQSPWSNLGRILTDAEWLECKAWRKATPRGGKFAGGDVTPDGRVFLGYERNRRGAEFWGDAAALELKRMRWRTCRRRALANAEYRKEFNDKRREHYASDPQVRADQAQYQREWRAENQHKPQRAARPKGRGETRLGASRKRSRQRA